MIPTFYHEETIKVGEDTLRLALDFAALDAIERESGRTFDGILREMTSGREEVGLALSSIVLWGLLRTHNPEIDRGQSTWLVNSPAGPAIGVAMGKLFEVGFPRPEPVAEDTPPRPRRPRGASKPSSSAGAPSA